ncbi:leucine-rich repeat-containing protein 19 [Xenopus laevis]|uniref:LRRCT domain-containing protein n=2 Tax=Xenopus laevis TaxID=8355 RepID=A0A974DVJ7_XENLA|nr:leucine-rich repeat-containing protein 19 [Xenopus laevis]OCT97806.1 hypothetical protein XELAEV_18010038mg [Xenopus laevis]
MKILLLMIWPGIISVVNAQQVNAQSLSNETVLCTDRLKCKGLEKYSNWTKVHIIMNNITSLPMNYFCVLNKLEMLNLSHNSIQTINEASFECLKYLKILDLSNNKISLFPYNIKLPFPALQVLHLHNNRLTSLDIREALKDLKSSLNLTISGNPWNCTCSMKKMLNWFNNSTVKLEDKLMTRCASPKNTTIEDIFAKMNCGDTSSTKVIVSTTALDKTKNTTDFQPESFNRTTSMPRKGNSWTFLVGVIVVGIVTSLVILFAVKFPRWYDYLLSYNHHRLKEETPHMFEEEFNVDIDLSNDGKIWEEEETVIVFEQKLSFVPEDDGFFEDKYIDERDLRAEI